MCCEHKGLFFKGVNQVLLLYSLVQRFVLNFMITSAMFFSPTDIFIMSFYRHKRTTVIIKLIITHNDQVFSLRLYNGELYYTALDQAW